MATKVFSLFGDLSGSTAPPSPPVCPAPRSTACPAAVPKPRMVPQAIAGGEKPCLRLGMAVMAPLPCPSDLLGTLPARVLAYALPSSVSLALAGGTNPKAGSVSLPHLC